MTNSLAEDRSLFGSMNLSWVTGTHEVILDCADPFGKTLHGDDVGGFDTR